MVMIKMIITMVVFTCFPNNWPQAHYHYHNHDGDVYLFLLIIDLLNLVVSTCAQAHTLLLVPGGKKC